MLFPPAFSCIKTTTTYSFFVTIVIYWLGVFFLVVLVCEHPGLGVLFFYLIGLRVVFDLVECK